MDRKEKIHRVLTSDIDLSGYPSLKDFKSVKHKAVWCLWVIKDKLNITFLAATDLETILKKKFNQKNTSHQSIRYGLNSIWEKLNVRMDKGITLYDLQLENVKDLLGVSENNSVEIQIDEVKKFIQNELNSFVVPHLSEHNISDGKEMAKVYVLLYCFENSVRNFITTVLGNKYGPDWFNKIANNELKKKITDRQTKELKNRWHSIRGAHPIYYTDIDDLLSIIRKEENLFKNFFEKISWIENRLEDITLSRNILAHNNKLPEREVSRLVLHFQDWCNQLKSH